MNARACARIFRGKPTSDGAGVKLNRVFAHGMTSDLDPFLLLDEFGSKDERDYVAGFPWHPHRGIETVTYLLDGSVAHGDSLGNSGTIGPGDLQWMTAGSGIIHEEMPRPSPGGVRGFQLWVNLAASEKMKPPAYRGVLAAEVPIVSVAGGELRALAGAYGGALGPVRGVSRSPLYFDVRLEPGARVELPAPAGLTAFAYVYAGSAWAGAEARAGDCVLFGPGDGVEVSAGDAGASFIFAAATPLREPVAWGGPIVMNTREELETAFRQLDEGTFIGSRRS